MSLEKIFSWSYFVCKQAHVRDRGYFSNHDTGSKTRKIVADISKFSWPYFRFGALHNELKPTENFPLYGGTACTVYCRSTKHIQTKLMMYSFEFSKSVNLFMLWCFTKSIKTPVFCLHTLHSCGKLRKNILVHNTRNMLLCGGCRVRFNVAHRGSDLCVLLNRPVHCVVLCCEPQDSKRINCRGFLCQSEASLYSQNHQGGVNTHVHCIFRF